MNIDRRSPSKFVLIIFIAQIIINTIYMLWVKHQPNIILNSWFVLMPLLGYFYFTFGFIAAAFMYQKKRLGLNIGFCVMLFGIVSVVISYFAAYQKNDLINMMIIPLIVINCCVFIYMAFNQSQFTSD
jgi:hypothetical protein